MNAQNDIKDCPGQMKIVRKPNGLWQLHTKQAAWESSLENIMNKMGNLGVYQDEIELAITTMSKNGHDEAYFGIWGTFLFSEKK